MEPISVLLVDDDANVRRALRWRFALEPRLSVAGEASDGADALTRVRELKPGLVVMDVQMPVMDGVEACRQMHAEHPGMPVVCISMADDPATRDRCLAAGATAFVSKNEPGDALLDVIRAAATIDQQGN